MLMRTLTPTSYGALHMVPVLCRGMSRAAVCGRDIGCPATGKYKAAPGAGNCTECEAGAHGRHDTSPHAPFLLDLAHALSLVG